MKDNTSNKSPELDANKAAVSEQEKRRKAVRNILMAGGSAFTASKLASTEWTKPVIESVVLPAHAATSNVAFSINDPVSLSYSCTSSTYGNFLIDITGYIDQPIAGITVRLVLSWTPNGSMTSPLPDIIVQTDANGNYQSLGNDIGYGPLTSAMVVATLPAYPAATPDTDSIVLENQYNSPYYYCAEPTTTS